MTVKSILKLMLPPVLVQTIRWVRNRSSLGTSEVLFEGDDELFKAMVTPDCIYGEYGCGASTVWVAQNVRCAILSVDSSSIWIDKVKSACNGDMVKLHFSDLGPVGQWGRPRSYQYHDRFEDYTNWIWMQDEKPNVVLIDGRFRVCCFLTCLMYAAPGTKVLFDDYSNRPEYHYVETYLRPLRVSGRQALFIVPSIGELDLKKVSSDLERFRFVFD